MLPVPMTLQTLAVLAVGAPMAPARRCYAGALCEGAAGLPVFANFQAGLFLPTGEISHRAAISLASFSLRAL